MELKTEKRLTLKSVIELHEMLRDPRTELLARHNPNGKFYLEGSRRTRRRSTAARVAVECAAYSWADKQEWSVLWTGCLGLLIRLDSGSQTLEISKPFGYPGASVSGSIVVHVAGTALMNRYKL